MNFNFNFLACQGSQLLILLKNAVKLLDNSKKVFSVLAKARTCLDLHAQAKGTFAANALSLTA